MSRPQFINKNFTPLIPYCWERNTSDIDTGVNPEAELKYRMEVKRPVVDCNDGPVAVPLKPSTKSSMGDALLRAMCCKESGCVYRKLPKPDYYVPDHKNPPVIPVEYRLLGDPPKWPVKPKDQSNNEPYGNSPGTEDGFDSVGPFQQGQGNYHDSGVTPDDSGGWRKNSGTLEGSREVANGWIKRYQNTGTPKPADMSWNEYHARRHNGGPNTKLRGNPKGDAYWKGIKEVIDTPEEKCPCPACK